MNTGKHPLFTRVAYKCKLCGGNINYLAAWLGWSEMLGITLDECRTALQMSPAKFDRWLNARVEPTVKSHFKVCAFFGRTHRVGRGKVNDAGRTAVMHSWCRACLPDAIKTDDSTQAHIRLVDVVATIERFYPIGLRDPEYINRRRLLSWINGIHNQMLKDDRETPYV